LKKADTLKKKRCRASSAYVQVVLAKLPSSYSSNNITQQRRSNGTDAMADASPSSSLQQSSARDLQKAMQDGGSFRSHLLLLLLLLLLLTCHLP
jgi:hypothetical protein